MGKTNEEYFVQRGGKWVPVDMEGGSDVLSSGASSSSSASESYYIQRDGKWVQVGGVTTKQDLIDKLGGKRQQQLQRYMTGGASTQTVTASQPVYQQQVYQQQPMPQPVMQTMVQPPVVQDAAPDLLEHKEYFITVQPPPEPERVENEYVEGPPPRPMPPPIVPQQRPVMRRRPPPPARPPPVMPPPPQPNVYNVHPHYPPPPVPALPPPLPPPQIETVMLPNPEWDSFEMGRRAFYEQQAYADYDDDDDGGFVGPPRTTPAEGYYLAGYLYYGDPSQAPELRPMPGC